jgi:DNA-binding transcriptional ArsR family regulator
VDAALKAIAEPRRREILQIVAAGELAAGEIASHFDISGPAVSQHLAVLKDAGLIAERREGTRRLYSVREEGLDEVRQFLDSFWDVRLLRLKHAAEWQQRKNDQQQKTIAKGEKRGRRK